MTTAAPEPKANMGRPEPRYDARLKVTGEARYPSDVPVAKPAFAYLVTSAIAKGGITAMDVGGARDVPGVLDIFTHENTSDLKDARFGGGSGTSIQKLGPDIAHDGQIIAMVVADTYEAAREAAYKVHVTYAPARPSATFGSEGASVEDATAAAHAMRKEIPRAGDAEGALAGADVAVDAEYATPTQHHNPMELFTTTCAWEGDKLTVYEPSQFVYGLKNGVAQRLGIDPDKVRVVSHYVGGAFGSRGSMTPRTALVAFAARKLNRPVKLVPTRDQGFTIATYRAETGTASGWARGATASSSPTATRDGRLRYGPTPTSLPAWTRAPTSTGSAPWRPRSTWFEPTATRRAICARRPSFPTSTRSKARWTSWPSSSAWIRSSCVASTIPRPIRSRASLIRAGR
jgi:xanthine dehydrogenase YagR molybdenum-binding subunit